MRLLADRVLELLSSVTPFYIFDLFVVLGVHRRRGYVLRKGDVASSRCIQQGVVVCVLKTETFHHCNAIGFWS